MSLEPICDFCGASDKFRCKFKEQALRCPDYTEHVQGHLGAFKPPNPLNIQLSMTIEGPSGPITVKEEGDFISIQRQDGDPIDLTIPEVESMVTCLSDLLTKRK